MTRYNIVVNVKDGYFNCQQHVCPGPWKGLVKYLLDFKFIYLCAIQPDLGGYLNDGFLMEAQQFPSSMMVRPTGEGRYPEYRNEEAQRNMQFLQNSPDVSSAVSSSTGIKIRSRQLNNQSAQSNASHGTAPRRIRLQMNLQARSNYGCLTKDLSLSDENTEVPMVMKVSELFYSWSI